MNYLTHVDVVMPNLSFAVGPDFEICSSRAVVSEVEEQANVGADRWHELDFKVKKGKKYHCSCMMPHPVQEPFQIVDEPKIVGESGTQCSGSGIAGP